MNKAFLTFMCTTCKYHNNQVKIAVFQHISRPGLNFASHIKVTKRGKIYYIAHIYSESLHNITRLNGTWWYSHLIDTFSYFYCRFEIAIFVLIFLNMVSMGIEHYNQSRVITFTLEICNALFTTIFSLGKNSFSMLQQIFTKCRILKEGMFIFKILAKDSPPLPHPHFLYLEKFYSIQS